SERKPHLWLRRELFGLRGFMKKCGHNLRRVVAVLVLYRQSFALTNLCGALSKLHGSFRRDF
ncbi:MAG: hypothetical protein ABI169_09880, partial [Chitinophagaceae bacterium]